MPEQSATIADMEALKAHVRNGQIVLDDPVALAEGMELEVRPISRHVVGDDGYTDEEREELLRSIERGQADVAAGRTMDADEFFRRLEAEDA